MQKVVQSDGVITVEYELAQTQTNGGEVQMASEQTQIVQTEVQPTGLALIVEPEQLLEQYEKAARALVKIVERAKAYVEISGRKFIRIEGWVTLGALFGLSAQVTEVKRREGEEITYEATAVVTDRNGRVVSRATALCSSKERIWQGRDEYQIMSMAQTRAVSKAFRLALSAVVVLGGYEPTPAEEITPEPASEPTPTEPQPMQPAQQQAKTIEQAEATERQLKLINRLIDEIKQIGVTDESALEELRVTAIDMTVKEASETITLLEHVRDTLRAWKAAETPTQRAEYAKRIKELRTKLEGLLQSRREV
jgi:hypothetical protein